MRAHRASLAPVPAPDVQPDTMGESQGLGVRLLVSPASGRLRHLPPAQFREGAEWVEAGQAVALVEQGSVAVKVVSPIDGHVSGILVRDGEPVLRGQPLVWLDEAASRSSTRGDGAERPR